MGFRSAVLVNSPDFENWLFSQRDFDKPGIIRSVIWMTKCIYLYGYLRGIASRVGLIIRVYAINFGEYPGLVAICLLPLLLGIFHLNNEYTNQGNGSGGSPLISLHLSIITFVY
jgi:hypothetical protein